MKIAFLIRMKFGKQQKNAIKIFIHLFSHEQQKIDDEMMAKKKKKWIKSIQ